MKKNYSLFKVFFAFFSVIAINLTAQISGTVTINSAAATAGTNYQSFTALASALNTSGINGNLVVNVVAASGPYVEQPSFTNIPGTSSTSTITINGNGNLLTFGSTNFSQPWVLGLNGADYMNFNGLNVQGTSTYAYACMLYNAANYNSFTSCTFSVQVITSTNNIPVVISGSGTSFGSFGNGGSYNTWKGCTMYGGGYGVSMYGNTSSPSAPTNNSILNCTITDWYSRGINHYYIQKNTLIKGNTIQRPNRTTSTTTYGIYSYYNEGTTLEGNRIQRLFDSHLTSTNTSYGIYMYYNTAGGGKANAHHVKNNIVSDIKHNGTIYGMMLLYIDGYVYHNTISLDNATSTAGTTYGFYTYTQSNFDIDYKNNNVSITRGGSGTKYCMSTLGITGNLTFDRNNYYINSPAGTNYVGFYSSTATNLTALQAQGVDLNSFSTNPMYTNAAALNYIPTSTTINNQGYPVGVYSDIDLFPRSGTQPDIGAHEFLSVACVSTPSLNSLSPSSFTVCSGENVNLALTNYYSDLGITYQWQYSFTSAVGPFTNITGATNNVYTTPSNTTTTYYGVVMTCTNGNGSINPVADVNIEGVTTSSVPYYEGFEGINKANKLPNCSWTSNSLGVNALTYTNTLNQNRSARTGTKYGAFYGYYVTGSNYFYTNGIQLNAGVTYSASLWYKTDVYGNTNFTDLSIMLGTSQSTTGLVSIASSNGIATSVIYKSLSNTFTVATSGIYYVAIKASTNGNYGAYYLSWDDLEITIPCSLNSPTVSLVTNTTTVCKGQTVNLTASGADDYLWSTGDVGAAITATPQASTLYNVVATSTLSGCAVTMQSQLIVVNPSPIIYVNTNKPTLCMGQSANITAFGSNITGYVWSNSSTSPMITVSPNTSTTYSVIATNAYNCSSGAAQQIVVVPNPTVIASSNGVNPNEICKGESVTLNGSGATTYSWSANTLFIQGQSVVVNPVSSTVYTLSGEDANGCVGKVTYPVNVNECTGIFEITTTLSGVKIYPNPTAGLFTVELNSIAAQTVEVTDLTGRVILTTSGNTDKLEVNVSNFASGIYYVKIQSNKAVEVIKVVKQ